VLRLRQTSIAKEIISARDALKALDRSFRRLAPMFSAAAIKNGAAMENGRARPRLSAKGRASLVLQGRYMGFMRQLNPSQKTQVRRIRETKGVKVAIVKARELAGH
jgi:hypothetical protein